MMPLLQTKQKVAADFASSFAPASAFGIALRNIATRLMSIPFIANLLVGRLLRDDIELLDYIQD